MVNPFSNPFIEKLHPRGLGGKWVAKPKASKPAPPRKNVAAPPVKKATKVAKKAAPAKRVAKKVTPKPKAKAAKKTAARGKGKAAKPMRYAEKAATDTQVKKKAKQQGLNTIDGAFGGEAVEIPEQPKQKGVSSWAARWDKVDDATLKRNAKQAILDAPQWAQKKGRTWYSDVSGYLDGLIEHPDARKPNGEKYTKEEAAAVIAMYSSNNAWLPNLRQARDFVLGKEAVKARDAEAEGRKPNMHYHDTVNMLTLQYKDRRTGELKTAKDLPTWFRNSASGSSKMRNFTANCSGDEDGFTADRFVARITLHTDDEDYAQGMLSAKRTKVDGTMMQYGYERMEQAWRDAVDELRAEHPEYANLTYAQAQAIPWLAVGGDGTGIAIPHHLRPGQPGWEDAGGIKVPKNPTPRESYNYEYAQDRTPEQKAIGEVLTARRVAADEARQKTKDQARKLLNVNADGVDWYDQPSDDYPGMTRREGFAVGAYIQGGFGGMAVGNKQINSALRERPDQLTGQEREARALLDNATLAHPIDKEVTVQRVITNAAVRQEILANLDNPDYTYSDPGYMSMEAKGTSPSLGEMAQRYDTRGQDEKSGPDATPQFDQQIFMEAVLPKGTRGIDVRGAITPEQEADPEFRKMAQFSLEENEFILPRGTQWRPVGLINDPNAPAPIVRMEPVLPTVARIPPDPEPPAPVHLVPSPDAEELAVGRRADGTMDWDARAAIIDEKLTQLRADKIDTQTLYRDPVTKKWSPERRAQQVKLIEDIWAREAAHVPNEGRAIFSGGLGGAGKGYALGEKVENVDSKQFFTVNPDNVKEEMARRGMVPNAELGPEMTPMELSPVTHEEASDIANELAARAYRMRKNIVWDITMSSESSVASKRLAPMRDAGYTQVGALFIDTTVDISKAQATKRWLRGMREYTEGVGEGGRYLPSKATEENLPTPGSGFRSKNREVFEAVKHLFDGAVLYENLDGKSMDRVSTEGKGLPK